MSVLTPIIQKCKHISLLWIITSSAWGGIAVTALITTMQPLPLPHPALSLCAHSSEPLISIGTTSDVLIARAAQNQCATLTHTHTLDSVHSTTFFNDTVLAASSNSVHTFHSATPGKVYALPTDTSDTSVTTLSAYDVHAFLAGDSEGGVHLVDTRTADVAATLQQGDYIAALCRVTHLGTDAVLSASGDGTLCAYDVRLLKPRVKLMYATDTFHDDLLSLTVLDGHAVAGTLSGALNVYDLRFLDVERSDDARVDRFFGHPECVNAVLKWEDCVITASSDGYVRVVDVMARRLLGVLEYCMEGVQEGGKRKGEDTWPVEGMVRVAAWDRPIFALQGHDEVVRFCDGRALVDEDDGQSEAPRKVLQVEDDTQMGKKKKKKKPRKGTEKDSAFFDDL